MKTNNLVKLILGMTLIATALSGYDRYNSYGEKEGFKKYKVISSTPITQTVTQRVKVGEEIRDRVVKRAVPCNRNINTNSIGLDTIIGAGIGLAIGNRVGKGHGREVAKVLGGLGGGYMANQMRVNSYNSCYEDRVVHDVIPRYETITKEVVTGYQNCVIVDGERLCKESSEPLKFIKVKRTYSIY